MDEVKEEIIQEKNMAYEYLKVLDEVKNLQIPIETYNKYKARNISAEETIVEIMEKEYHIDEKVESIDKRINEEFLSNDNSWHTLTFIGKSRALKLLATHEIKMDVAIKKEDKSNIVSQMIKYIN